jgi:D-alanyl-D-alanine carboxypeptidase/D-alanyl-D-alanine-endopeptidase (penicillin-binding protein 4)
VLASVSSPPLSALLSLMNLPSDDFFAELLAKQLGVRFTGAGTTAAGAKVIAQAIASFGLHPRIVDGSGLSRSDQTSPDDVVSLLRQIWRTPLGRVLYGTLPIVGKTGTARRIGRRTAAEGRCVAKTGTLDYVTNLAGYCTANDHHVLAFALMMDGPGNWTAHQLLNQMVPAIARY